MPRLHCLPNVCCTTEHWSSSMNHVNHTIFSARNIFMNPATLHTYACVTFLSELLYIIMFSVRQLGTAASVRWLSALGFPECPAPLPPAFLMCSGQTANQPLNLSYYGSWGKQMNLINGGKNWHAHWCSLQQSLMQTVTVDFTGTTWSSFICKEMQLILSRID